jgi:hypothetical protein
VLGGLLLGIIGLVVGIPWLTFALAIPGVYALFVVIASVRAAREGLATGLWYLIVLPCIHFGWGTGFVLGFLKLTKNITAQTGR